MPGATRLRSGSWLGFMLRGARVLDGPGRQWIRLDPAHLLSVARRRTRLRDLGEPAIQDPLDRLVQSLEREAQLSFVGRIAAREDLSRMLMNRLRMERDRLHHPEIAAEQIKRPLFITGLPRSGSTFLHGLLAQDPANRVPLHWEVRAPSPPPQRETYDTDPRIEAAERQLRWLFRLAPDFQKIHQISARMPEVCVIMLSHSFLSFQFSSTWFVPSYQEWLEEQDLTPAYLCHRKFLQQLQWRCPGERWVLKAPPHLPGLRALFATYPDANVVLTHRDPLEVVASVASLHVALRRTFSNAVDPLAVGPEVTRMLADDIRRGYAAYDDGCAPPEQFTNVSYLDLMRDPMQVVRRIYRRFDLPLSAVAEARMRRYLEQNPKDKHGPHLYSLAQYGLRLEIERERYRAYVDRWQPRAHT